MCMSQAWENALWALMCQERLGILMTIMEGQQLKGMYLKNKRCGLKTLNILRKDTSDRTCHSMMQSCWKNLVFVVSSWVVKLPGAEPFMETGFGPGNSGNSIATSGLKISLSHRRKRRRTCPTWRSNRSPWIYEWGTSTENFEAQWRDEWPRGQQAHVPSWMFWQRVVLHQKEQQKRSPILRYSMSEQAAGKT